jgi:predicted secreted protein
MAAVSGNLAKFYWGGTAVGNLVADVAAIGSVSLDGNTVDVTKLSADTYREFIAGKRSASFSIELFYNHTAHSGLTGDFLSRTIRPFKIDFSDGNVEGDALLTSVQLSAGIDDAARISISAQITGDVTINNT